MEPVIQRVIHHQYLQYRTLGSHYHPPTAAPFTDSVQVTISGSGGPIYYTIDGTDPTASGSKKPNPTWSRSTLPQSATIKAAIDGVSSGWSSITSASFIINHTPPAAPVIGPDGGTFNNNVAVTITGSGGTIYYTTDGSDPTDSGTRAVYEVPFTLTSSATVKAAVQGEYGWSDVVSKSYTINNPENPVPEIDPNGGAFTGSVNVKITRSGRH